LTNNNYKIFSSAGLDHSLIYRDLIVDAPDLGFFQLTVKDAATLIAIDMWRVGGISAEVPKSDSYDLGDQNLRQALSIYFSDIEERLTAAIDAGSLKTTKITRNLNEELEIEKTLISQEDLRKWAVEHGLQFGGSFDSYLDEENNIKDAVIDEIYTIRVMSRRMGLSNKSVGEIKKGISEAKLNPDSAENHELWFAVKELNTENADLFTENLRLKQQVREKGEKHPKKSERPLSTRARRTLLTIIAALCNKAGINYEDRGAAQRISEITEEIGTAVTDDTIRKIISEIDDAVETRTK